jgi:hypothetical protein
MTNKNSTPKVGAFIVFIVITALIVLILLRMAVVEPVETQLSIIYSPCGLYSLYSPYSPLHFGEGQGVRTLSIINYQLSIVI